MGRPRKGNSRFGTVNQLPSGNWRARYQLDGEFYNKSGFVTSKEAWAWLATIHNSVATGTHVARRFGDKTFAEVAQEWLDLAKTYYERSGTITDYEVILRASLIPALGSTKLSDLDVTKLRAYFADESKTRKPSTLRKRKAVLSLVFKHAREMQYCVSNPVDLIRVKAANPDEMVFLNQNEVLAVSAAIGHYSLAIQLAAYSGLRAGELWDLRVGSLDFDRNAVQIVRSVREVRGHGMVSTLTTKGGTWRSTPVPAGLMQELREFVEYKAPNELVFTSEEGKQVRQNNFYDRNWIPAVVASGIQKRPRFHDLRHTCAAFYFAQQRTGEEVRRILGHSNIQTTHKHYAHIFPEAFDRMSADLDVFRVQGVIDFERAQQEKLANDLNDLNDLYLEMRDKEAQQEQIESAACHDSVTPIDGASEIGPLHPL